MIQLRKTLEIARSILVQEQIDFALIGGFALAAHGIHRATKDIDILVDGAKKNEVKKIFLNSGFKVVNESTEVIQFEGPGYLDIVFANRPLSLAMLRKSKDGLQLASVPVVSCEALIGLKIQAYKNDPSRTLQDKADIQALLKNANLNLTQVKEYADLFNAWDEIMELKNDF
jgi:hypothetical protein